jgi:thioredoxin 1
MIPIWFFPYRPEFFLSYTDIMKKLFSLLSALALSFTIHAANAEVARPYDETADAHAAIAQALKQAQAGRKNVLLIFGANWCKDCLELDKSMHGQSADLIAKKFVVVKIDVGQFDKNKDIAESYGNPIKKGIPAAVVLNPDNSVVFASKGGELSNARRMSEQGVYDFFNQIVTQRQ